MKVYPVADRGGTYGCRSCGSYCLLRKGQCLDCPACRRKWVRIGDRREPALALVDDLPAPGRPPEQVSDQHAAQE